MSHYQNQYGANPGTDQYGNPIRRTDEYGNVISEETGLSGDPRHRTDKFGSMVTETDEYGNPIRRTDEFGSTGTYQTGVGGITGTTGERVELHHQRKEHHHGHGGAGGVLQRSGSSSSSSSEEDDGMGGRRKKGIKEKIKEKLPGHHDEKYSESHQVTSTTTPGGYTATTGLGVGGQQHEHEKKGIMDKIKEKLPGHH